MTDQVRDPVTPVDGIGNFVPAAFRSGRPNN